MSSKRNPQAKGTNPIERIPPDKRHRGDTYPLVHEEVQRLANGGVNALDLAAIAEHFKPSKEIGKALALFLKQPVDGRKLTATEKAEVLIWKRDLLKYTRDINGGKLKRHREEIDQERRQIRAMLRGEDARRTDDELDQATDEFLERRRERERNEAFDYDKQLRNLDKLHPDKRAARIRKMLWRKRQKRTRP